MVWAWQRQTASDTVHAVTALLDMTTAKQLAANDDAKDRFWYALPYALSSCKSIIWETCENEQGLSYANAGSRTTIV